MQGRERTKLTFSSPIRTGPSTLLLLRSCPMAQTPLRRTPSSSGPDPWPPLEKKKPTSLYSELDCVYKNLPQFGIASFKVIPAHTTTRSCAVAECFYMPFSPTQIMLKP